MILLELTEQEAEAIQRTISLENDEGFTFSERERRLHVQESVLAKIKLALQAQPEVLITSKDLFSIVDLAKSEYRNLPDNLCISNKMVEQSDLPKISLAKALIMWLNSRSLLKNLVSFDFTDTSSDFEEDY